jgi:membrane protein YdbS with pleckstrin-like domain
LVRLRWLLLAIWFGPLILLGAGLSVFFPSPGLIATTAAVAGLAAWLVGRTPRQVRALNYAVRQGDFLKRSGLLFRHLEVVPHIRIQYVDLNVGPLERAFRLASLNLHTAAPGVAAALPGISPQTAAALRDQLTARDKSQPPATPDPSHQPTQPAAGATPWPNPAPAGPVQTGPWPSPAQTGPIQTEPWPNPEPTGPTQTEPWPNPEPTGPIQTEPWPNPAPAGPIQTGPWPNPEPTGRTQTEPWPSPGPAQTGPEPSPGPAETG